MLYYNLPKKFGYDPLKDVQILVPVNKGIVGVENLNLKIQEKFNRNITKMVRGNTEFRLNDKIIHYTNPYQIRAGHAGAAGAFVTDQRISSDAGSGKQRCDCL